MSFDHRIPQPRADHIRLVVFDLPLADLAEPDPELFPVAPFDALNHPRQMNQRRRTDSCNESAPTRLKKIAIASPIQTLLRPGLGIAESKITKTAPTTMSMDPTAQAVLDHKRRYLRAAWLSDPLRNVATDFTPPRPREQTHPARRSCRGRTARGRAQPTESAKGPARGQQAQLIRMRSQSTYIVRKIYKLWTARLAGSIHNSCAPTSGPMSPRSMRPDSLASALIDSVCRPAPNVKTRETALD